MKIAVPRSDAVSAGGGTALSFRAKLLSAMILLVLAVTGTTLLITENQLRSSNERHFQQSFNFQIESFLQQRESRLAPVKERSAGAAPSARLIAAIENADQPGPDQQRDVDDLYRNGIDQLREFANVAVGSRSNLQAGFLFFFLNTRGEVMTPSAEVQLPFSFASLRRMTLLAEAVGRSVIRDGAQQVGYLPFEAQSGAVRICEMVFTPIVDVGTHRKLGVLAVGFPLPEARDQQSTSASRESIAIAGLGATKNAAALAATFWSGIWLDGRLYSASIRSADLPALEKVIAAGLESDAAHRNDIMASIDGVPHQVYFQALNAGTAFPPAYQVCLYSLADAIAERHSSRQTILLFTVIALIIALALSVLISRGFAEPLQQLAAGAMAIERGDYEVKVPVRCRDEIGRLGEAFNDMTDRIRESHAELEQRIAERTRELVERKKAEEALRQSETSLREAQRIAHLGNWKWDVAANELRWSDEIYAIFGLTPEKFGATYEAFLDLVHSEDRDKVAEAIRESIATGKTFSLDHRVVRPGGEVRIVHAQAEAVRNDVGKVIRLFGTIQDITEQKRIEAEFLRAQRMDSIGALAGGMAHDLNNALSPILMGIQLIRRDVRDPETQQMLCVMEANTHRGAEMVRQVLTFARGKDGERELLDVSRLVREMENIARQTLPKTISVAAMVPPDLWPVLGNSTQLHQVLLNLCINARDAMPNGGQLTLAADNVEFDAADVPGIPSAAPGCYVMLLVMDSGTGIPPEILPRIFEPFFTTKGPGKGTGLGLSTISRIVRNHGGFVNVKSEVGDGTTFEVCLPRAEKSTASKPPAVAPQLPPGRGELILFVDDDRSLREMVVPALKENGYRVVSAGNGAEALTLFSQHEAEVRLVLSDLGMPVMDGKTTVAALRACRPTLPVIFMSGELDSAGHHLGSNGSAFLQKPFRLEQLLAAIAEALRHA
jgi:PAS domain S-box-containing protein